MNKAIDIIKFLGNDIPVYHNRYMESNDGVIIWQMRNPDTCYQGIAYLTPNGVKYPDDAIIPNQTDWDREVIPKAIVVAVTEITDDMKIIIQMNLKKGYNIRNRKVID